MNLVSSTFSIVTGVIFELSIISSPVNVQLFSCLAACIEHQDCGGIIKHEKENFKCEFVVDASVAGATSSSSTTAYRLNTYGNKRLFEISIGDPYVSMDDVDELCKNDNLLTPNYPTTKKQRTVLTLRNKKSVTINLRRQPDGSFQNSEGEIISEDLIEWASGNPDDGDEDCMRLGIQDNKFVSSDGPCDYMRATSKVTLFCV